MRYITFHIKNINILRWRNVIIFFFQLKISYNSNLNLYTAYTIKYYGITQDPITKDFMIIMDFCQLEDLAHYITKEFFNVSWYDKLHYLSDIACGLWKIHKQNIIHRDFHNGNILIESDSIKISDLRLSKSATESSNYDNEIYGIIPYVASEIFQGQKYTQASDIYSFGMVMWEIMTGRRPFWNWNHDTELIIEICDRLRPPIGDINAPDGYIELIKECWKPDPIKRPSALDINKKIFKIRKNERKNPTDIVKSSDIGPIAKNIPGVIYKSRLYMGAK